MATIGITGGSGSGKTTLADTLADRLGRTRCAMLCQDSYYHDLSALPPTERAKTDFDSPAAVDLTLLAAHLRALAAGRTVTPPRYDFATHTRPGAGNPVAPAEFVIVEGLLIAADDAVAAAIDVLVFVDLPDEARFARRTERDTRERSRTVDEVNNRWATHARPSYDAWVLPARERADLVVSGDANVEESVDAILDVISH